MVINTDPTFHTRTLANNAVSTLNGLNASYLEPLHLYICSVSVNGGTHSCLERSIIYVPLDRTRAASVGGQFGYSAGLPRHALMWSLAIMFLGSSSFRTSLNSATGNLRCKVYTKQKRTARALMTTHSK